MYGNIICGCGEKKGAWEKVTAAEYSSKFSSVLKFKKNQISVAQFLKALPADTRHLVECGSNPSLSVNMSVSRSGVSQRGHESPQRTISVNLLLFHVSGPPCRFEVEVCIRVPNPTQSRLGSCSGLRYKNAVIFRFGSSALLRVGLSHIFARTYTSTL